jgi:valine dehydrogenase (NAD+)
VRIPELRCQAVVGAANNQLADESSAKLLADAGVVYAPDYVANAGGIINIAEELSPNGYHPERARASVRRIFDTTRLVLAAAESEGITTVEAADRMAERRMDEVGHVRRIRTFH